MSHRYPTRFQATFQAKRLQATLTHLAIVCYQTRLQTKKIQAEQQRLAEEAAALEKIQAEKRRAAEAEAALAKTVEYSRELMNRIHAVTTLVEKLELLLLLYQHFYDEPILLAKNYVTFRAATWEKMNEQEVTLLAKLQTLPASLGQTSEFWHLRGLIIQLLDQMEWVRAKYW
jgi:hypothetical protein